LRVAFREDPHSSSDSHHIPYYLLAWLAIPFNPIMFRLCGIPSFPQKKEVRNYSYGVDVYC
jgi:hypothetical protein